MTDRQWQKWTSAWQSWYKRQVEWWRYDAWTERWWQQWHEFYELLKMNLQAERWYENDEQSCNDGLMSWWCMWCNVCIKYKLGLVTIFLVGSKKRPSRVLDWSRCFWFSRWWFTSQSQPLKYKNITNIILCVSCTMCWWLCFLFDEWIDYWCIVYWWIWCWIECEMMT